MSSYFAGSKPAGNPHPSKSVPLPASLGGNGSWVRPPSSQKVLAQQKQLIKAGYKGIKADGQMGPLTKAALADYHGNQFILKGLKAKQHEAPVQHTAKVQETPSLPDTQGSPYFAGQKPTRLPMGARGGKPTVYVKPKSKQNNDFLTPLLGAEPAGQEAAGQTALHQYKAENTGLGGTIIGGVTHPLTDLFHGNPNVGGVASDLGNLALNLVSPEKAGLAAGLFGLRGLKDAKVGGDAFDAYKAAKAGKSVEDVTPQEVLRGTLRGAKQQRGVQEAGYSAERAKRFAAANTHLTNTALPPEERLALAKHELKGELPKIDYQGMKVLDEEAVKHLQTVILDHPHLLPGQKIRAAEALSNAMSGTVPTRSELTLLEHIFGKQTVAGLVSVGKSPFKDTLLNVLNVPRSLMASFDLSAPFRQGLVVGARHPAIFAKNFKPMIKAFGSEKFYHAALADIRARPTYPMMMEAKLSLTELGHDVGAREERFASDFAETLTGGKKLSPVRMSGRAYTGFLDKTRADVFDHLIQRAQGQGINVQDQKFLRGLGTYINAATGRGDLGHFQEAGKVLNTFFFSPRLLASRLNFMNPLWYARLDPFSRKEALRSAIQLAGTLSTLVGIASQIPGVKVNTDPRNADWGKIRLGNTRVDIGGGFQQPLRLFAQLATGTVISSTTGKRLDLTSTGFGKPNRLDIFIRFFEGKEAPWASVVTDYLRNSNQVGTPFKWSSEAYSHMVPLLAQDTADLYNSRHGGMNGIEAAFAGFGVGSVGFGLQTYAPKPVNVRPSAPSSDSGGFSDSGGSDYFSGGSSGGSGYFGG